MCSLNPNLLTVLGLYYNRYRSEIILIYPVLDRGAAPQCIHCLKQAILSPLCLRPPPFLSAFSTLADPHKLDV